jgi:hypothetical protein
MSSWTPAVTSPTVSRVRRKARLARRAKNEVKRSITGIIVKQARARFQSRKSIATTIPMRLNRDPRSWVSPCEKSWLRVSTSFVTRLIKSPTGLRSKKRRGRCWRRSKILVRMEARRDCPMEPTWKTCPREAMDPTT